MSATTTFQKTNPRMILMLGGLAVLSLAFVWSGVSRMLQMQTHAANKDEFAQLKPQDEAKIVVEVTEASTEKLRGKLLERVDETHYARTNNLVAASWSGETKVVMGKTEDIHGKAVVHITGRVALDRTVHASQIVILTGYVQVK